MSCPSPSSRGASTAEQRIAQKRIFQGTNWVGDWFGDDEDRDNSDRERGEEEQIPVQAAKKRIVEEQQQPQPSPSQTLLSDTVAHHYVDARDAQFDACNRLRRDLERVETREEKRNLIRERMPECYLVFVYVFHTTMSLGPLQNAAALDECSDLEVEATTPPQSLFALFDSLQDEETGLEEEEERKEKESDAAREICAWLRVHSDHADWVHAILNRDPYEFHSLFGPLVSYYSLESNLRWYFEQQKRQEHGL